MLFCLVIRYFTGGEEDLELPDLIDGLERYRQLREPEQQGLLAKEEQPYLDPDYGTLPASKDEDLRFECDHCHKVCARPSTLLFINSARRSRQSAGFGMPWSRVCLPTNTSRSSRADKGSRTTSGGWSA